MDLASVETDERDGFIVVRIRGGVRRFLDVTGLIDVDVRPSVDDAVAAEPPLAGA